MGISGVASNARQCFQPNPPNQIVCRITKVSRFLFPIIYVPVFALSVLLTLSLTLLALVCLLFSLSSTISSQPGENNGKLDESACCADVNSPRRLGVGETVEVQILANRKRNETGLLLLKGEIYTAKYLQHQKWKDGKYFAEPTGVEFDGFVRFLARFVEWLRPYPEGMWFQLVGRIDRGHEVFPVLDAIDAKQPYQFKALDDGELVLFVNDVWYRNNSGNMTISIQRH